MTENVIMPAAAAQRGRILTVERKDALPVSYRQYRRWYFICIWNVGIKYMYSGYVGWYRNGDRYINMSYWSCEVTSMSLRVMLWHSGINGLFSVAGKTSKSREYSDIKVLKEDRGRLFWMNEMMRKEAPTQDYGLNGSIRRQWTVFVTIKRLDLWMIGGAIMTLC